MPPKWARRDFDADYDGYLEPNQSDIGDQTPQIEFVWLERFVVKNATKHNVSSEEIAQVFANEPRCLFREKGDVAGENKYLALGKTDNGRHLLVIHIVKANGAIMPISARDMEPKERKRYERK